MKKRVKEGSYAMNRLLENLVLTYVAVAVPVLLAILIAIIEATTVTK